MIEKLAFTKVQGQNGEHDITVYALSTCGFCKRAMKFLDANSFSYHYIFLDNISIEAKNETKKELKAIYKTDIAFPFATLGKDKYLVGFIEADWKLSLGVS